MKTTSDLPRWFSVSVLIATATTIRAERPERVVFPGEQWLRITPEQAGLDVATFAALLSPGFVLESASRRE
jgi:hypothetical protein